MTPAEIFLASVLLLLVVFLIWGRWQREHRQPVASRHPIQSRSNERHRRHVTNRVVTESRPRRERGTLA
jgi:hypothetical protein